MTGGKPTLSIDRDGFAADVHLFPSPDERA